MCRRDVFEALGGFDERLETDEDFDFCVRLKAAGGVLFVELPLTVEHYGFPRTWPEFFRRERWHARGDAAALRNFLASRVAILSVVFALGISTAMVAAIANAPRAAAAGLLIAVCVLGTSIMVKFRAARFTTKVAAIAIFSVYFVAHALAVFDSRTPRSAK